MCTCGRSGFNRHSAEIRTRLKCNETDSSIITYLSNLKKESIVRGFEKEMLRRIFESTEEEVTIDRKICIVRSFTICAREKMLRSIMD